MEIPIFKSGDVLFFLITQEKQATKIKIQYRKIKKT